MSKRRTVGFETLFLVAICLAATGCETTQTSTGGPLLFFPSPPDAPRVQFLTWASGADQVELKRSDFESFVLGEEALDIRTLIKPYGIAARDGVVYVCDSMGLAVVKMDFKNQKYSAFGHTGSGKLRKPINIVIDPLGYKFVADPVRKQVVVFSPEDKYTAAYDIPSPGRPVDVAVHGNELYVLDNDSTPQVVVLNRQTGEVIRTFGSLGSEPGEFKIPGSISVAADGSVYVSDTMNWRIQKLTKDGEPIWQKGTPGYMLGQFGRPRGLRVAPDGVVFVADGATELVQMLNPDGKILMHLGGAGTTPGAMVLPSSVAIDATSIPYFQKYVHKEFNVEYLIFVVNQYGEHLINVYAFGAFPEGYKLSESQVGTLPAIDAEDTIGPVEGKDIPKPDPLEDHPPVGNKPN